MPDAEFSLVGNDYSGLNWIDDRPKPTQVELEAAFQELTEKGVDPLKGEDWEGLKEALVISPLFQKCYMTAKTNQAVFMAFYKVEQVIITTRIIEALQFFLNELRVEMDTLISPEEIVELNNLLKQKGFNFTIQ